ncbi:hypothetical protein RI129_013243 [Pyrocoelia pectoralis]|uniref:Pre-rRNA-processing protein Ipi1 N-terminal domain-containing protein n=1 Tax=Pyrocoelia pectoralis TaxID=417401 RepID=A0AAN7ZH07_9COLE
MVKSKAKKAEKTKVKLKTTLKHKTKFLPKGGNVTKTDFKIKPIVIQAQLQEKNTEQPLSKRNLTFKELLTRLNHHNVNVKSTACGELSELIKLTTPQLVEVQLHVLLQGASKLLLDREAKVRRLIIQLIGDVLAKVSLIKLEPFFEILIMYTVCAMTHLDVGVQEDSLLIIDIFLKYIPSLIAKHHLRLFPNFLRLISKLKSESNPSRTLTLNLQGSSTSIRWRINVLNRLEGILKAIIKEKVAGVGRKCETVLWEDAAQVSLNDTVEKVVFEYWKFGGGGLRGDGTIVDHLNVLIPLLNEVWTEALPKQERHVQGENTVIVSDTASILRCTLGIFHLFWELHHDSDKKLVQKFLMEENQKYFGHVLLFFPYVQKVDPVNNLKVKKKVQLLDTNNDPKCIHENLVTCYMFSVLYKNLTNKHLIQKATDLLSYINVCLLNRNYVRGGNVDLLIKTLNVIFFENSTSWTKRKIDLDNLINSVIHFYTHNHLSSNVNVEIIKLLAKIVHIPVLNRLETYKLWLSQLPKLLCKPCISIEVIDCLSLLSRVSSDDFQNALEALLPTIFDNLSRIEIVGTDLYPPCFKIVNMFALLPDITPEHQQFMEQFAASHGDIKLSNHICNMIRERARLLL